MTRFVECSTCTGAGASVDLTLSFRPVGNIIANLRTWSAGNDEEIFAILTVLRYDAVRSVFRPKVRN